jgi:hypothetical protein
VIRGLSIQTAKQLPRFHESFSIIGHEVASQDGPGHQQVFSIVGWTTTPEGRTWRTTPVRASSKKSGQRSAAERLLDLLVEEEIARR